MRVYLDHDRAYQDTGCMAIAGIMVYLGNKKGLVETYKLQMGETIRW